MNGRRLLVKKKKKKTGPNTDQRVFDPARKIAGKSNVAWQTVNLFQCNGLILLHDSFNETFTAFLLRSNW